MPAWTTYLTDDFHRADTALGTVGNGWTDRAGNAFRIASNLLLGGGNSAGAYTNLLYQSTASRDQQVSFTLDPSNQTEIVPFAALRVNPSTHLDYYAINLNLENNRVDFWYRDNGALNYLEVVNISGLDRTHSLTFTASAVGVNPTTLTATITDATTGEQLFTHTRDDSTVTSLQRSDGVAGIGADNSNQPSVVKFSAASLASGGLGGGSITHTATSSTTITLTATAPTGGSPPYTYQWYGSDVAGFAPGAGNLIDGATALELVDTPAADPGSARYYVLIATDSASLTHTYAPVAAALDYAPVAIGFIGDSITEFAGALQPFIDAVYAQSGRRVTVVNRGASGSTSGLWAEDLDGMLTDAVAAFVAASCPYVLVMLGTNDAKTPPAAVGVYKAHMMTVLAALTGAGLKVILNAPPCPWADAFGFDATSQGATLGYGAALDELAAAAPTTTFRGDRAIWRKTANDPALSDDGVHPNGLGQATLETGWAAGLSGIAGWTAATVTAAPPPEEVPAPATGFALALPSALLVGQAGPVAVVLTGGSALDTALVVTLTGSGLTFGGSVTIAPGATYGTTTVTPTATGAHAVAVTHTGGNADMTDPSGSITATAPADSGGDGGTVTIDLEAIQGACAAAIAETPVRLNLAQPLVDTIAGTTGGALHGAWATAWGDVLRSRINRTLKLFGAFSRTIPACIHALDNADNPTEKVRQS